MTMDIEQLESQLKYSISYYGRILALLQSIDEEIGTASRDGLLNMSATLAELQGQATRLDQAIATHLSKVPAKNEHVRSLLNKREDVIKEILILNRNISAKAMGVKSLLAHEMSTLRNGLSALSGYRQMQHNQGRIVNSTS
jgi:chromosome segregation ATPase